MGGGNVQSLSSLKHLSRCRTHCEHPYFHLLDRGVGINFARLEAE